jgi:hypothetical protein
VYVGMKVFVYIGMLCGLLSCRLASLNPVPDLVYPGG